MDPKLLAIAPFLLAAMTVSAQDAPEPESNPAIIETDEIESPAVAQNRMMQPSWTIRSRSGATLEADIENGGGYSSWFSGLEVDLLYPIDERTALTFGIGSSITDYDFDGNSALSLGSMSDPVEHDQLQLRKHRHPPRHRPTLVCVRHTQHRLRRRVRC